jgi:hypothetical protein
MTKVIGAFHDYAKASNNTLTGKLKRQNVNEKLVIIATLVCRRQCVRTRDGLNWLSVLSYGRLCHEKCWMFELWGGVIRRRVSRILLFRDNFPSREFRHHVFFRRCYKNCLSVLAWDKTVPRVVILALFVAAKFAGRRLHTGLSLSWRLWEWQPSRDIPADVGLLCGKSTVLGDSIKETSSCMNV